MNLVDDLRHAPLVNRVPVGVQEADRDRVDSGVLPARATTAATLSLVERR